MCAAAGTASAQFLALSSNITQGNQGWTGALGMDFNVLSPITVTQLGAFDSGLNGFIGTITVGIFNRDSRSLVGTSASLTGMDGSLVGSQRMADVAGFNLAAGRYSIVAIGFSNQDQNGNVGVFPYAGPSSTMNTGGGLIQFVGDARYGAQGGSFAYPLTTVDTGPANRYDAGTFSFTQAVPEPSTYALALAAIAIVGGFARRTTKV